MGCGLPDLIILKKLNKQKECHKCGDTKSQVYNRGKNGMLCPDCYKKELKAAKKRWSRKYEKCLDCGTTKVPHRGHGRCRDCHNKYLYRTDPNRRKSIKKSGKKWAKKNPEKLKIINERASKKAKEKIMELLYGDAHIKKLEEQNYKCKVCGISQEEAIKRNNRKLYITHIDSWDDNSYTNIVAVCSHCHAKRLRGEIKIKDYL